MPRALPGGQRCCRLQPVVRQENSQHRQAQDRIEAMCPPPPWSSMFDAFPHIDAWAGFAPICLAIEPAHDLPATSPQLAQGWGSSVSEHRLQIAAGNISTKLHVDFQLGQHTSSSGHSLHRAAFCPSPSAAPHMTSRFRKDEAKGSCSLRPLMIGCRRR
ncbi:hypothetical protein GQ53DRAFT_427719 [Thozetella sp. PMI_491]|nr:hypothetical protein GQ53DRAFT_427719 [Thozetella sp. PMI_491]